MLNCPSCGTVNTERAKNDAGFFRSPSTKPIRVYNWRCLDCGFVGAYAEVSQSEAQPVLGQSELASIAGGDPE